MINRGLVLLIGLLATGAVVSQATVKPARSSRLAEATTSAATVLKGSDTKVGDGFGESVAVSANTVVIGAPGHDAGRAYVFADNAAGWQQDAELGASGTARTAFGTSVAISGGTIVVGAPDAPGGGRAYVFAKVGEAWRLSAELHGADTRAGDYFGLSVALSGMNIVVGAPHHGALTGRAYMFTKEPSGWRQTAELAGTDSGTNDVFATAVAISGPTVVVGALGHAGEAGRAYAFSLTGGGWRQTAELDGSDTVGGDAFGASVAVSGTTVVVGSFGHAAGAGRSYLFTGALDGHWRQVAEWAGAGPYDAFGQVVALSGGVVAVGSVVHASGTARVYLYRRGPSQWRRYATVGPSGIVANGNFGTWVAISGTTLAVGCSGEDSRAGRVDLFSL